MNSELFYIIFLGFKLLRSVVHPKLFKCFFWGGGVLEDGISKCNVETSGSCYASYSYFYAICGFRVSILKA